MSGAIKKTTGLVGLAVEANPHEKLKVLYQKIAETLQLIPKGAAYREYTEQIVGERLDFVNKEPDIQKLEAKINSGQIEEVISQAKDELSLARKMLEWKPWEPLTGEAPPGQWKWP